MPDCPHCSKAIESLSGFVPQQTLTDRLAAKQEEIKQYAAKVSELEPKAQGHDALVTDRDSWQGKYNGLVQNQERTTLLGSMQISADKLPGIEQLWQSAQASKAEGERATFGDWVAADDGAKAHPLLGSLFAGAPPPAQPDGTPPPAAAPPAPPPAGLPKQAGPTADPEVVQGAMTLDQKRAFFSSPEYLGMSTEDRAAKRAELGSRF